MTTRLELEVDFLTWWYHRQRIASGDSLKFERTLATLYKRERGLELPFTLPNVKPEWL